MRKQSRKTIRYHVFRQENRIKVSGATFLFQKIVPETPEEIFKNEKSHKRLWRDFFVEKNLPGDYLMSLQSQKVITDIFWRCFLAGKLVQTLFDDRSRKKNGLKDFLRFFQREKAACVALGKIFPGYFFDYPVKTPWRLFSYRQSRKIISFIPIPPKIRGETKVLFSLYTLKKIGFYSILFTRTTIMRDVRKGVLK